MSDLLKLSVLLLLLSFTACQTGGESHEAMRSSTSVNAQQMPDEKRTNSAHPHATGTAYTCPMHPQIVRDAPGPCPICGMALVPLVKNGANANELQLSESQMQLANIVVGLVSADTIGNATVLNARLAADQNQTTVISSRVAGRIERLVVKETGQPIRKGQVLYEVYSEQLLVDQQEYLVALQQQQELGSSEKRYTQFRQAAEQKLRLYGLTPDQIVRLARTRKIQSRIPFIAPVGGTVTEIAVSEGQYVGEGALLYRLVNLNQLWVEADLYAGESTYVKVGDRVAVEIVGNEEIQNLMARVTFINPEYRAGSQVLTIRAVLANPTGRLQPGQQARVLMRHGQQRGLSLPIDAVVRSGEGAVVFVQTKKGTFQPRRVQLGAETDERTTIKSGLAGSERVALSGVYLLYSELVLKKGVNPFTQRGNDKGVNSSVNAEANPMAGMKM